MDTRSPILRWREIVHPFFWPVFFWNLRKFAATLAHKIEENNSQGLVSFDITWWGGIRVHLMIDPDAPRWDAGLERCAKCVHLATLDVGNPYLSTSVPLTLQGVLTSDLSRRMTISIETPHALGPPPAPSGKRLTLAFGCFAEPAHLNTS
ncbi:MAG: hypothetical protein AAFQ22_15305, partial [Pseudomonadota bacterium]